MSTLRVTTLQNLSGTEVYTAKAWVNFNGTGTVAIRSSGNVSSITDNNTGDYTVNFTTAMPDANYAVIGTAGAQATGSVTGMVFEISLSSSPTSSAVRVNTKQTGTFVDVTFVNVAVFR